MLQGNRDRRAAPSRASDAMQPQHRGRKITAEDEEHLSAAALAKSTRLGHGMDDIDKNFAKNITSKRKFKMNDIDPDDEHDFGVGVDLYTKQCATPSIDIQLLPVLTGARVCCLTGLPSVLWRGVARSVYLNLLSPVDMCDTDTQRRTV